MLDRVVALRERQSGPTRGSKALAKILSENGPIARRLRSKLDKALLWRLATGRRGCTIETAVAIRILSKGEIPEGWWARRELVAERIAGRV